MKIAFLTPEYVTARASDGGLANYLKKTAAALAARGCEVWVFVSSDRDACWQDGAVSVREVARKKVPGILSRLPKVAHLVPALDRLRVSRSLARPFWKAHRRVGFDLVQCSSYLAPGYALLGNGSLPVVCRISSYQPLLLSAAGRRRTFADHLVDWLELRQVLDADATFAPSTFLVDHFRRLEGVEPAVVRTPLDLAGVAEQDLDFFREQRPESRYLMYFGTLNRVKGTDLLARVLPEVLAHYPDLSFVFIGRDDGLPCGTKIADLVSRECREFLPRITFLPALPKSRLSPFVSHAEGVVMPSRVDNYPNACLEALSLGAPVIASDNSSIEEIVRDGENGFLFANGDTGSLRDAIERLLSQSPGERAALSAGIRASHDAIVAEDRIGQLLAYYAQVVRLFREREAR